MSKRKKEPRYIDIKISGTYRVLGTDREDVARQVRERILREILNAHPSFEETGLPPLWEEWLDEQTPKLLGIEIIEADKEVEESLDVRWSNVRDKPLTKGGVIPTGQLTIEEFLKEFVEKFGEKEE